MQEEWIYQSKELGSLVDTEPFIFHHPDITEEARQRSRDCRMRAQPRLFTGIHFYLTGGFDSKGMSKADLTKLIALSGAKIVYRYIDLIRITTVKQGSKRIRKFLIFNIKDN